MNYRGSYRHLLKNSEAAMLAAIEIYNKPNFDYRDECFVILLLNAWELMLKAIISRNHKSIFYIKKRSEPYRTFSLTDAFNKSIKYFPEGVDVLPVGKNLDLLATYRDNAVHFYNYPSFGAVIYSLAQTSIVNFKDIVDKVFGKDIALRITWSLLPLGFRMPISPIEYISGRSAISEKRSLAVMQFLKELKKSLEETEKSGEDTNRLITIFDVKLESTKKITKADVIVGVKSQSEMEDLGPLSIIRTVDPNISHPLRQKDIIERINYLHGIKITSNVLQSIIWKYKIREKKNFFWGANEGCLKKYSNDFLAFLKNLSKKEIESAVVEYKNRKK